MLQSMGYQVLFLLPYHCNSVVWTCTDYIHYRIYIPVYCIIYIYIHYHLGIKMSYLTLCKGVDTTFNPPGGRYPSAYPYRPHLF